MRGYKYRYTPETTGVSHQDFGLLCNTNYKMSPVSAISSDHLVLKVTWPQDNVLSAGLRTPVQSCRVSCTARSCTVHQL